jgi:hypothetical protein
MTVRPVLLTRGIAGLSHKRPWRNAIATAGGA